MVWDGLEWAGTLREVQDCPGLSGSALPCTGRRQAGSRQKPDRDTFTGRAQDGHTTDKSRWQEGAGRRMQLREGAVQPGTAKFPLERP